MPSVDRNALTKYLERTDISPVQRELAQLRLQYSSIANLRNSFIASLKYKERIYPTILPTQASGRWSYIDPPLSNFPKKCINPECPRYHHSRTDQCWDTRDCLQPDPGTFWIEHDLNAVEHVIYCLILHWKERLNDLASGVDIHTPVTCSLFSLPLPPSSENPHSLCTCDIITGVPIRVCEHCRWRELTHWQGKDDTRRTMSKNFTYGGQYFYVSLAREGYKPRTPNRLYRGLVYNPSFVYSIPNIQSYLIEDTDPSSSTFGQLIPPAYEQLAVRFVETNIEIQKRKAQWMEKIRKDKHSRSLYGSLRRFYFANQATAKEGFNHMVQGTVASYINESAVLLQKHFPQSYLVHNKHDSLKWAFYYESTTEEGKRLEESQVLARVKTITQRELSCGQDTALITATYKVTRLEEAE